MSNLNYVPSWLDSAMTLLEKLNKCIEKIETIVNTVVSVTKTADDALSLAKTNETDINTLYPKTTALETKTTALETKTTALETKTTALETKTTTLETNVGAAKKEAHDAYSLANLANTTANTAQAIANDKSPKLYLHIIVLSPVVGGYTFKFWVINEESISYKTKFNSEEQFNTTVYPFNCVLMSHNGVSISKSLTLQLTQISFAHGKSGNDWNPQNCNGTIDFAAYLNDSNQIVTITDYPEWYSATVDSDYVMEL